MCKETEQRRDVRVFIVEMLYDCEKNVCDEIGSTSPVIDFMYLLLMYHDSIE